VAKQKNPASLRKFESSFDARRETVTARALEDLVPICLGNDYQRVDVLR